MLEKHVMVRKFQEVLVDNQKIEIANWSLMVNKMQ